MTHFTTLVEAGDRAEGGQTMTPDLIHELEARFRDVGRAPVTFGRLRSQAAPKAADIKSVAAADDNSELRAAIEPVDGMKGRLDAADLEDLSLGVGTTSGGGHYVHHAELKGDVDPPEKISGLREEFGISFADAPIVQLSDTGDVIRFSDGGQWTPPKDLAREM